MKSPLAGVVINGDPSWPASRVAAAILEAVRRHYGSTLDIDGIQSSMDEIWVNLHNELTKEELLRIGEVTHVSVPTNELSASITMPPSRQGYFVMFDAVLDLRLVEIFTAPRNEVAWAACYVRAAWGNTWDTASWVRPAFERMESIRTTGSLPDSFSVHAARDFIFAHECGHLFLNHLSRGFRRKLHFGEQDLVVFDPAQRDEIDADKFARDLLCRREEGRPLLLHQMGVDWLFGFLGAVLAMRQRADAWLKGRPEVPLLHSAIAKRRAEAWKDYNRRCAESPNEEAHAPESVAAVQHVRESVDNFNNEMAAALADIYAAIPKELLDWQARVIRSPMRDGDVETYRQELGQLAKKALAQPPPRIGWVQRLRQWVERML